MAIYNNILDLIGNTPLFRLNLNIPYCELYLKLENCNPGRSVKDRAACNMILEAEKEGIIKPGDTIIESSSGNTGVALAMLCAAKGYHFICVVDNHGQEEKIQTLKAYGAIIEHVGKNLPPNYHAAKERVEKVNELCNTYPDTFFINQGDNLNNRQAHYKTTANEIYDEVGMVDFLFSSVGTGGSISGTGKRLKELNPNTKLIAIEPQGSIIFGKPYSPFFQSGAGSAHMIFKNVDFDIIDENCQVSDKEAFNTCRYLAQKKGLLLGGTAGGVVYKAIKYIEDNQCSGVAVAIIPDGGERYFSTVYNDEWMSANDLFDNSINLFLDKYISKEL
jgi:cystathionine beta-synthase